jgi:hypothetical protein
VRQFFYHACFAPEQPKAKAGFYRELVRQIIARNPRRPSPPEKSITIPGYPSLRALSQEHEALLKARCGGPWQSYFLRSHWRMVFPVWQRHQERMARQLRERVRQGAAPIVHLFRFPRVTINHGILLYNVAESADDLEFEAYDPNRPAGPVKLTFDHSARAFEFPPSCYWAGGRVSVVEIFRSGLY